MSEVSVLKSKKTKIVLISAVAVILLVAVSVCVISFVSGPADSAVDETIGEYSTVAETEEDVENFVRQFNFELEELYSLYQEYVPIEFNGKYTQYNELQKKQGLHLEKHKGDLCKCYVYKLKDYTIDEKTAYMTILVYEERVIGGHISTLTNDEKLYTFAGEYYE